MTARTRTSPQQASKSSARRDEVIAAASTLFGAYGYHGVGIDEVAAAVGITGGAIYRHFRNKHELLSQVILSGTQDLHDAVNTVDDIEGFVGAMASVLLERRELGVLLQRESRHLDPETYEVLGARVDALAEGAGALLRRRRPELGRQEALRLVHSGFAVLGSPAYHGVALPAAQAEGLLRHMVDVVLSSSMPPSPLSGTSAHPRTLTLMNDSERFEVDVPVRASRREMLLAAAVPLFARHGYHGVRTEDIGAAVGITGPSLYSHFETKAEILSALVTRASEWLQLGVTDALATAASPRHALTTILDSYVGFVLHHTHLMGLLFSEEVYLPSDFRRRERGLQHEYVAEWVRLLLQERPDLASGEAWFLVHGVLAMVNDNAQSGQPKSRPELQPALVEIGLRILHEPHHQ